MLQYLKVYKATIKPFIYLTITDTDIIVCQPTTSSSSDSNFEAAPQSPISQLCLLTITHNEPICFINAANDPKCVKLKIEKIPGINILRVEPTLSISDLLQIDVTPESDERNEGSDEEEEEMALNMKNKITPITSPTNRGAAATKTSTARAAIFNVSRVKKVELGEIKKAEISNTKSLEGGNVLRKVASITAGATSTPVSKKNNVVPEKLNFATVEKFEGLQLKLILA